MVPIASDVPVVPIASDVPAVPIASDVPVGPIAADVPVGPIAADAPLVPVAADVPAAPATPVAADSPVAPSSDASDDTIQVENVERSERRKRSAVLPNGYLADTPEVAAAKAAHFAEHAKAANNYYYYPYASPLSYYPYAYAGYPYAYSAYPHSYAAPTVVTADGYLADTPEVAAAKAAHFAEHAAARSRSRRDTSKKERVVRSPAHTPASTSPLVAAPAPVAYAPYYHAVPVAPAPVAYAPYYHTAPFAPAPIVKVSGYPYVYPWIAKK